MLNIIHFNDQKFSETVAVVEFINSYDQTKKKV